MVPENIVASWLTIPIFFLNSRLFSFYESIPLKMIFPPVVL